MKTKLTLMGSTLGFACAVVFSLGLILPSSGAGNGIQEVTKLAPSWTATGGGGVFSAYVGPNAYGYVSPGATAIFDGRAAGIIKAGLAIDPTDGIYEDEGLFGFKPTVTIDALAASPLTYDVENQSGENPVWMTIEVDTGVAGDRSDNTTYQFVPTTNPAGWHTVDAAAGQWQKWNNSNGDVSGNPLISLSDVAAAHPGCNVVRAYLRLGMGDSYHGIAGQGTVAWVDKATIGGVTYDFEVVRVSNLQPDWAATGGGGVFSAYVGPDDYNYVSPGATAIFDGREAGIIKAGLTVDPTYGDYEDEGLFGFKPTSTIDDFATSSLTYDVENQSGENPVWMTIEVDTGVVGNRSDNTTYQFVPTTNPSGWHTVDAAAGQWQKWNNSNGDVSGNPLISLSAIAAAHSGCYVVRAYLRLGMGDSYHGNAGQGTVAWVDTAIIDGVNYDFVIPDQAITFDVIADQVTTNTVVLSATASSGLPVSISVLSGPAVLNGSTLTFTSAGSVSIVATQSGNINWHAATSVTNTFTVSQTSQTITFAPIADQVTTNTMVLSATASSGLAVSFELVDDANATLVGETLTFTGAGDVSVRAIQAGDALWAAADPVTNTFAVSLTPQTINFPPVADALTTDTVPFNATASSGLSVTYQLVSGPGRAWVGNALTFLGDGMVSVRALQGGDVMWAAAEPVTNTFLVSKAPSSISLDGLAQTYSGSGLVITPTSGQPGLTMQITYDGSATAPVNAGTYQVIVTIQDSMYQGCVTGSLTIARASQVITFPALADQLATNEVLLSATASSGLPVSFSVASGPAEWDGTTLTFTNYGSVSIVAAQSGNGNWNAAPDVTNTFNVTKTPQTITFPTPGDQSITNAASLSATASSELPVSFSVVDGPGLLSDGTNLTFNGVGPVSIVATQGGDDQWAVATPVTNTINATPYPAWQKPDFVVDAIVTTPSNLTMGCTFSAVVTVRNSGLILGNACTLKLWANHAASATNGEASDASQRVGNLAIGETRQLTFTGLTAPGAAGTYNIRAFVDGNNLTPETSDGNNQRTLTYSLISGGGGTPAGKPDFTVTAIAIAPTPLTNGCTFAATVTVLNQGTTGDADKLRLWLNHGATATAGEAGDAELTVGSLAAGASTNLVFSGLTAPSAAGTYYIRTFVDADNSTVEQAEGNNQKTLTYSLVSSGGGTPAGKPDFTITTITTSPTSLTNGCTFAATVTVLNQGTTGDAGKLRLWLNHGATATAGEAGDAELTVGSLAAGASTSLTFTNLTAPSAAGTYYIRSFVDADNSTVEQAEGNNQKTLTYSLVSSGGGTPTGKPDFTVTTITTSPASLTNGCTFAATVTVKNQGAVTGDAGVLKLWLNHGATATTNEPGDRALAVGTLAAGTSTSLVFTNLTAASVAGTYNLRAFVDGNNATAEQSEGNNQLTLTYSLVSSGSGGGGGGGGGSFASKPDFMISSITFSPATLTRGCTYTAYITIVNNGSVDGNAGALDIYLNRGATATVGLAGDANQTVGTMTAGETRIVTFTGLTAPAVKGTYNFRAFIDSQGATAEQSEGNNQKTKTYGFY